jgi:S1-C subfamily serine protease
MTAAHVVQTADVVKVEFVTGEERYADVVSSEPAVDVALIKLRSIPPAIPPAKLGDSDAVEIGSNVFVIGTPYGVSHTLTVGHISGRHTQSDVMLGNTWGEFFQTDAAVNPGNSGGPMFDMNGEVIGIVSHIYSQSGGNEGIGFAVTAASAKALLLDRQSFWTGISGVVISGNIARALNVPQETGYLVQRVAENSPADLMGIKPGTIPVMIGEQELLLGGDVVLGALGISLSSENAYDQLKEKLNQLKKNDRFAATVLRGGKSIVVVTRVK